MGEAGYTIFHAEASTAWGGQELRILAELEGLARRGSRTGLICEQEAPIGTRARALGCPVHPVRFRWSADPAAIRRIARILRDERVDVLATHSSLDAWVGGLAARWCGVPVVRTRHLDLPLKRNPLSRMVYRRLADTIVVTGASGGDRLIAGAGVPAERVFVVPTGIDLARFHPAAAAGEDIRRALDIPASAPIVGTVGVLRAIKGTDVFLRGCRMILDRIPAARFLVVGDGPMRREVRELREALGLSGVAHLLGQREDIPELLAAMDVFVFPSLGADINSQAVSQAMAMGVAVAASDIPGNLEQARAGETALLFAPGDSASLADAACRLLWDPDMRRALAARALARVRSGYTLHTMLDRMDAIYRAQAGSGPPRRATAPSARAGGAHGARRP